MKKIFFHLFLLLSLTLLSACGQHQTICPPDSSSGSSMSVNLTRGETPEPVDSAPPEYAAAESGAEPRAEKIAMVMVGGELYCDTGLVSEPDGRCGMMDGQITSSVEIYERPDEDGQSNFGSGYGWQYGPDPDTIEINMDGVWRVFRKRSEMRVRYCDTWYDAADVSDETLRWLQWFNSLGEDEQLAVSYTPLDLYELCGYPLAGDTTADAQG